MATGVQVVFDAIDPRSLGGFWMEALGYVEQPPPGGFETWEAALEAVGYDMATTDMNKAYAIVDPDGKGPRFFFQKVPESKSVKNRVHVDVHVGPEAMGARADQLVAVGATRGEEHNEPGGRWIVMQDPEGNEFCLH